MFSFHLLNSRAIKIANLKLTFLFILPVCCAVSCQCLCAVLCYVMLCWCLLSDSWVHFCVCYLIITISLVFFLFLFYSNMNFGFYTRCFCRSVFQPTSISFISFSFSFYFFSFASPRSFRQRQTHTDRIVCTCFSSKFCWQQKKTFIPS